MFNDFRDFSYCYSVTGRQFARIDHFVDSDGHPLWTQSPSHVTHLPQNLLETFLREEVDKFSNKLTSESPDRLHRDHGSPLIATCFGYEVCGIENGIVETKLHIKPTHSNNSRNGQNESPSSRSITAKYVIAADGAKSYVRDYLNIDMVGQKSLQTLMNLHFVCPGLYKYLKPRPAMLYFTFNEVQYWHAHISIESYWYDS